MKNSYIFLYLFLVVGSATFSCAPQADDEELQKMCEHLKELRGDGKIETDVNECISEGKREGVTKRQAQCRISASNTQEYFVRCRTGEARK